MADGSMICSCGVVSPEDALHCEGCGRRLDGDELLDLDELTDRPAPSSASPRAIGRRGFWVPFVVGLSLLAGAVGLYVVVTDDADETNAPGPEAAAEPDEDASDDDQAAEPSTDEGEEGDAIDSGAGSVGDSMPEVVLVDPLGPDADYGLIIGTQAGLTTFDAGRGELTHHPGTTGEPVAVSDGRVVLVRQRFSDSIVALELDDLSGEARPFSNVVTGSQFLLADSTSGLVLIETFGPTGQSIEVMDIATQEVVKHPLDDLTVADLLGWSLPHLRSADEVIFSPTVGGVYVQSTDGARLVAPGGMQVTDGDRLLVETCDDAYVCSRAWYDIDGQPLELIVPSDPERLSFAIGTDWVASRLRFGDGVETLVLTNIVTGDVVRVQGTETISDGFRPEEAPAISPDGRWLATASFPRSEVELRNLITDEIRVIPLSAQYVGGLLFTAELP